MEEGSREFRIGSSVGGGAGSLENGAAWLGGRIRCQLGMRACKQALKSIRAHAPGRPTVGAAMSVTALLFSSPARGGEICEYAGRTNYSGAVSVRAEVSPAQNETGVRVALRFTARFMMIFEVEYLAEEISHWRNGELQSVALNTRYLVNNRIIRQQWDDFDRGKDGFAAYRVQGKNGEDFRRRYPAFSRYWSPSMFGQPWLAEYQLARPERRPDLDLSKQAIAAGLRSPLSFAFYWIRTLRPVSQTVPVFLPGNKRQSRVDLSVTPPEAESGLRVWHIPIHFEAFRTSKDSQAMAWISPSQQVEQIAFYVSNQSGTGSGVLRKLKCERR